METPLLSLPPIRRKYQFVLGQYPNDLEKPDPISITVPDDTFTLTEILQRFNSGILPMGREGYFDGPDVFVPDMSTLDLVEIQELRDQALSTLAETEEFLRQASKKQEALEDEARYEAEIQKRLEATKSAKKETSDQGSPH